MNRVEDMHLVREAGFLVTIQLQIVPVIASMLYTKLYIFTVDTDPMYTL